MTKMNQAERLRSCSRFIGSAREGQSEATPIIIEVKRRPDILLRELTMRNREALHPEIAGLIRPLIMT